MDSSTKAILLEQCGKNRGYRDADIRGFRPDGGVCVPGGPEVIASGVSLRAVCQCVAVDGVELAFSCDAGRYVCDYTYYLSLLHGNGYAVLIHVPPLSPQLPASLLGKALQVLIKLLLEEIGKDRTQAWLTGNSTMVLQAKGKQLRPRSLREIKCLRPVCKVQLCSEKLLKTASKTIYKEGKNSELAQRSHQGLFCCLKKEEHSKAFLS
ncbi:LOW QUALITY PROTEIN: pyroglutamyl-peptidase 1-like protein [Tamandua tetradactyla]|uniref:LOW QUALITY PROTEIN: pyroglutamyl-peptidase 1-like protein n=1 Tax=Tamandua tetradactyla TaxID=48850 RepID=UPI00405380A2